VMGNGFGEGSGHIPKYTNGRVETTGLVGLISWFAVSCFPMSPAAKDSGHARTTGRSRARRPSPGPQVLALAGFVPSGRLRLWRPV
jgi:hypothetical protein